jgi:hypothetical protein
MEENIRVRYSDKELEEFKALIERKNQKSSKRFGTYQKLLYE